MPAVLLVMLCSFVLVCGCSDGSSGGGGASSEERVRTGSVCLDEASALGAPCGESEECGPHRWCEQGACAQAAPDGEPCSDGVFCGEGLVCQFPEMICGPPPARGEACWLTRFGPFGCPQGLGCRGGVCEELPGLDEACTMDNRCAAGLGCAFERGGSFCRRVGSQGAACENDQSCGEGLFCDYEAGRCAARLGMGASCRFGNECESGSGCVPIGRADNFRCWPLPERDEPCVGECGGELLCVQQR